MQSFSSVSEDNLYVIQTQADCSLLFYTSSYKVSVTLQLICAAMVISVLSEFLPYQVCSNIFLPHIRPCYHKINLINIIGVNNFELQQSRSFFFPPGLICRFEIVTKKHLFKGCSADLKIRQSTFCKVSMTSFYWHFVVSDTQSPFPLVRICSVQFNLVFRVPHGMWY